MVSVRASSTWTTCSAMTSRPGSWMNSTSTSTNRASPTRCTSNSGEKVPLILDDNWFCEYVKVRCLETQRVFMFPFHRWVPLGVPLKLKEFDMVLPQDDEVTFQRRNELQRKKEMYEAVRHAPTNLLLVSSL